MQEIFDSIVAFFSNHFAYLFAVLIVLFITVPAVLVVVVKKTRAAIGKAIKGSDDILDWHEIVKAYALFTNFICLLLYTYMIVTHGINEVAWSLEDKLITAGIAVGADATLITSLYVKYKSKPTS